MSIRCVLLERAAPDDGRLVLMRPLLPGSLYRVVYATRDLYAAISAGAASREGSAAYRIGLLLNDIDSFSTGALLTVGYGKERRCVMKRLDPHVEEVWELRSRAPKPSLRIFGRFAEPDVFVATHMARRDGLGGQGSQEWAAEIRRCKAIWRQLFPTCPPHTGRSVHDYITSNVVEVGRLP